MWGGEHLPTTPTVVHGPGGEWCPVSVAQALAAVRPVCDPPKPRSSPDPVAPGLTAGGDVVSTTVGRAWRDGA